MRIKNKKTVQAVSFLIITLGMVFFFSCAFPSLQNLLREKEKAQLAEIRKELIGTWQADKILNASSEELRSFAEDKMKIVFYANRTGEVIIDRQKTGAFLWQEHPGDGDRFFGVVEINSPSDHLQAFLESDGPTLIWSYEEENIHVFLNRE